MKKLTMTLFAVMILMMTACEKEEINPSKPDAKDQLKACKRCQGTWDITESTE